MKTAVHLNEENTIPGGRSGSSSIEATVAASGVSPSKFLPALRRELRRMPDPDMALNNFLRFLSAGFTSPLVREFSDNPALLKIALTLFSHSHYLADILVRNPELLHWLTSSGALSHPMSASEYANESILAVAPFERTERKMDALKRFQRRQILRISARDILESADLETTTKELSWLADAIVDGVVRTVFDDFNRLFGAQVPPTLSVIGLGKLGGEELNFSSDIDLMFVYDEDGDVDLGKHRIHTYHEYYSRAAETILRCLTEHTAEGHLYRVDVRLRPDGSSGPLAMSRNAFLQYYETRGELWERQMLLKARVVAGDRQTGFRLLKSLRPFVHPSTTFREPLEEIRVIKERIESTLNERQNVKLSKGGIRDIEFVVQALQLLRGGSDDSVREHNSLRAIDKLRAASILSDRETTVLRKGYEFLRNVEHRLQLLRGTQTHELPTKREEFEALGKRLGFQSSRMFERKLVQTQTSVRKVYDSVFRTDRRGDRASDFSPSAPGSGSGRWWSNYGFEDPETSEAALAELQKEYDRLRDPRMLRTLLGALERLGAPDWGLKNFSRVAAGPSVKRLLEQAFDKTKSLELLLKICSRSLRITQTLANEPLLVESLLGRSENFFQPGLEWDFFLPHDPVRFRLFNESKVAIRFLIGDCSIEEASRELSVIAETLLRRLTEEQPDEFRKALSGMCIVALGKFGGREMLIGSDLDLLALHRQTEDELSRGYEKATSTLLKLFRSDAGALYEIDMRLRPEGKNAPLATEFSYYEQYLRNRAELWEKQALLKARVLYGNDNLRRLFESLRKDTLSGVALSPGWIQEFGRMRRKMELERDRGKGRRVDLKVGKGGLVDLEFALQALQLKECASQRIVPTGNSFEAIRHLGSSKIVKSHERKMLKENYEFLRRLEFLIRLNTVTNDFVLPEDKSLLRALAAGMKMPSRKEFLSTIQRIRKENRQWYLKTLRMQTYARTDR